MAKILRILEVPIYLLIIAYACMEKGHTGIAIFLGIVSIARFISNSLTDDFIYKK